MDYIFSILPAMLEGSLTTVELFFVVWILSVPLGLLVAIIRILSSKPVKTMIAGYIWVMRGSPLMLQMMFIYYGLPFMPVIGIRLDDWSAALIAFVINYAAYFAEIFRAGIQAIDKGQYEAARSLGMSYTQTMRRIVLPQVVRHVLPPVANETITLVKDTSLIYVLAMNDLMRVTRNIVQRDFSITPFLVAIVFYLIMTLVLTVVFEKLEKKYSEYN